MKRALLSAKLDYLLDYAKKQYSVRRGLRLNSKDWESFVSVRSAVYYSFLINGTVKFTTKSKISGKTYEQYVKLVNFKRVEPALLLLFLIDTPEDQVVEFLNSFLLSGEAKLSCQCASYIYHGAKYNLTKLKSCYGPGEIRPPDVRDPLRKFLVCKHLWLVLVNFEKHVTEFAKGLLPYYKRAFGLASPTGLERLKKNLGDSGLKRVVEEAVRNTNALKSDQVKRLFDKLTSGKLNEGINKKLSNTDAAESRENTQKEQDSHATEEHASEEEGKPVQNEESLNNKSNTEEEKESLKTTKSKSETEEVP